MCDMTAVSWLFGVALVAWVAGLPVRTWSAWKLGSRDLPGARAAGVTVYPPLTRSGCNAELPHMVCVGVNVWSLRAS